MDRSPPKDPIRAGSTSSRPYTTVSARLLDVKVPQPVQSLLLNKMSDQVTVTGTLVKPGGVPMIYIESVK